jgi:hypothetical protein
MNTYPVANSQPYTHWAHYFRTHSVGHSWPQHWKAHCLTAGVMERTDGGLWRIVNQMFADDGFGELIMSSDPWFAEAVWNDSNCQHYAGIYEVRYIYI